MNEIKEKRYIEFTKDGITDKFYEGDRVICRTKERYVYDKDSNLVKDEEGHEYRGEIINWCTLAATEGYEPTTVIFLNTSKNVFSYSMDVIRFNDIEFMCNDYLAEADACKDMSDDEVQKNTYIHVLSGMGYDRDKIENTWCSMEKLMKQFDISFEKAMCCVLYSLKYDCNITVPLKNICGIDMESIEKSIPIYQKEAAKCLGRALVSGVCYFLANMLNNNEDKE